MMQKMFHALRQPSTMAIKYVKPGGDLLRREWPSTDLEILDYGLDSELILRERLPQFHDTLPELSGMIPDAQSAITKLSLRCMKLWDIDRPFVFHNVKSRYESELKRKQCIEGLNLDALYEKSHSAVNRLNRDYIKELREACVVEATPPNIMTVLHNTDYGSFLDGPFRSASLIASQQIYSTHMSILSESATRFHRGSCNHTIMFQGIKIIIPSTLCHKAMSGEKVEGTWAGLLLCDGCNREAYDGDFTLTKSSIYPVLSLGLESEMLFHPIEEIGGKGDKDELFYEYMANKVVSGS